MYSSCLRLRKKKTSRVLNVSYKCCPCYTVMCQIVQMYRRITKFLSDDCVSEWDSFLSVQWSSAADMNYVNWADALRAHLYDAARFSSLLSTLCSFASQISFVLLLSFRFHSILTITLNSPSNSLNPPFHHHHIIKKNHDHPHFHAL